MEHLSLLFTKDGLQWQVLKNQSIIEEQNIFLTEESNPNLVKEKLSEILHRQAWKGIKVLSALNHFSLMPEGFSQHELGKKIISYNANIDEEKEELMLSINKKYGVQFYYLFPQDFYREIKALEVPTAFNFTGEKFLNTINPKKQKEIHINLYHHQVEFLALEQRKLVLYNNLDATSEVDFLYFIMFSLNKIGFNIGDTHFYVYGEVAENDTFISELEKFVPNMSVVYENGKGKNFILK